MDAMMAGARALDAAPGWTSLVELLRWRGARQAEDEACTFLVNGDEIETRASYGELDERARAVAAGLQDAGAAGERVLLLCPPGLDYVTSLLGCLYAGAVAVPAYPPPRRDLRPATQRLAAMVADAGARFVLAPAEVVASTRAACEADPAFAAVRWLSTTEVQAARPEDWRETLPRLDSVAYLQYTSGATGQAKGVVLTHANLLHNLGAIHRWCELGPRSRSVIWLPPYHDMGLIGGMFQALYSGYPVVLLPSLRFMQRPILWLRAISRFRAQVSGGPNFAYDLCTERTTPEQRAGLDLSSWRAAFNGAEAVRADTLDRFATAFAPYGFRSEAFRPCYGLAEATLLVAGSRSPRTLRLDAAALQEGRVEAAGTARTGTEVRTLVSCGPAWGGDEITIVDPRRRRRSAPGRVGEVWVRGPSVAAGYWNRGRGGGAFGARLAGTGEGPFLRTGDLGFVLDGDLFVTGRRKELIVVRGRNHHPQDVERTVEGSCAGLQRGEGAAFAVEVDGEERLVVVQAVARSWVGRLCVAEAARAVAEAVARDHGLRTYAVLFVRPGTIPRTSSGKVMRHACRRLFVGGRLAALGRQAPASDPAGGGADAG